MVIKRFRPSSQSDSSSQFEKIIEPHLLHLYQLAYRFCSNQQDAEDLVQDVVIKLLARGSEVSQIEKIRPWLAKILYRQFVDNYRQKLRSPLHLVGEGHDYQPEQLAPASDSPEFQTEMDDKQKQLQIALNTLNENQRTVVLMHDVEGYTLSELETILETPQGTLKSRLNRARSQLREKLLKI